MPSHPQSKKPKQKKGTTLGTLYFEVAEHRRKDMKVLLQKKRYDGAKYIGGYVIECYLKFLITRRRKLSRLPADLECHNLNVLADAAFPPKDRQKHSLANNSIQWVLDEWHSELRYQVNRTSASQAKEFCNLVDLVYDELKEFVL